MMVAEQKKGRRGGDRGGRGLGTTEFLYRRLHYTTGTVYASTRKPKRAGAILDSWVIGTYRQAERWQRIFERSGEVPDPRTHAVLSYLQDGFLTDSTGQMALFLAWREHRLTEPRRDPPEDYREHNLTELSLNVETFFTVLVNLGRLEAEEARYE